MQQVRRKRTRPLSGVNGEVCKKRKKELDRVNIVREGRIVGNPEAILKVTN
jgi:hypothetical protein